MVLFWAFGESEVSSEAFSGSWLMSINRSLQPSSVFSNTLIGRASTNSWQTTIDGIFVSCFAVCATTEAKLSCHITRMVGFDSSVLLSFFSALSLLLSPSLSLVVSVSSLSSLFSAFSFKPPFVSKIQCALSISDKRFCCSLLMAGLCSTRCILLIEFPKSEKLFRELLIISAMSVPFPGPTSTNWISFGLFNVSFHCVMYHTVKHSPNTCDTSGAVTKSPLGPMT
mmetsp:Transcript_16108/g.25074  ORF Transcript_16108/g.25074 Transcript_16108/m.25074 type:complete len:226 (+) Transcript_16108:703-1380(+)